MIEPILSYSILFQHSHTTISCAVPSVMNKRLRAMLIRIRTNGGMSVFHLSRIRVLGKGMSTVQGVLFGSCSPKLQWLLNCWIWCQSCLLLKTPRYFDETSNVLFPNHPKFFGNTIWNHSSVFHIIVKDSLHLVLLLSILWVLLSSSNSL